jgi:WD40 repeat protein
MRTIRLILWVMIVCWVLDVRAQDTVITPDNASEIELLAQVGWFEQLYQFELGGTVDLVARPLWASWVSAFSPDGTRFVLGNDNNEVVLFDVISDPPFITNGRVLAGHQGAVYSLAFHPDGVHLASGGADGVIHVWDMTTGTLVKTIDVMEKSAVYGLSYRPLEADKLYCATLQGVGTVNDGAEHCYITRSADGLNQPVYSVAFSPDGRFYARGDTILQNLASYQQLTLQTRRGWSDTSYRSSRSRLTFSADGQVLLNGGTQQWAYVWHMNALAEGQVYAEGLIALSPSGRLIAGNNLMIVDTLTGDRLYDSQLPKSDESWWYDNVRASVHDAVFSPDGRLIVTAGVDGVLRFWGITDGGMNE